MTARELLVDGKGDYVGDDTAILQKLSRLTMILEPLSALSANRMIFLDPMPTMSQNIYLIKDML